MDQTKYEQMMKRVESRRQRALERQVRHQRRMARLAANGSVAIPTVQIPRNPNPIPMSGVKPMAQPRAIRRRGKCGSCGKNAAHFKAGVAAAITKDAPTLAGKSSKPPTISTRQ